MEFEKMKNVVFAKRTVLFTALSVLFWIIFFYIEGYLLWGIETFSGSVIWKIDLTGHAIAGMAFSINLFFLLRNATSPRGTFRVLEHWLQGIIVFAISVSLASIGWEILELLHDTALNPEIPAQIDSFDTTLDIAITSTFSFIGTLLYIGILKYLKKIYPDESLRELITRNETIIENVYIETREKDQRTRRLLRQKMLRKIKSLTAKRSKKRGKK